MQMHEITEVPSRISYMANDKISTSIEFPLWFEYRKLKNMLLVWQDILALKVLSTGQIYLFKFEQKRNLIEILELNNFLTIDGDQCLENVILTSDGYSTCAEITGIFVDEALEDCPIKAEIYYHCSNPGACRSAINFAQNFYRKKFSPLKNSFFRQSKAKLDFRNSEQWIRLWEKLKIFDIELCDLSKLDYQ
uniref:Uncharacterized protein n=1 Tax=Romanomermis culicivorax TaxID=13658 RepID=A0A915HK91_ROMCU